MFLWFFGSIVPCCVCFCVFETYAHYAHVCKTLQESEWALRLQSHTLVHTYVPYPCSCIKFFYSAVKRNQFHFDSIWFRLILYKFHMRLEHERSIELSKRYKWYLVSSISCSLSLTFFHLNPFNFTRLSLFKNKLKRKVWDKHE